MPNFKLRQLQQECDTWKRSLAFMIEENINLKKRLSELLQESLSNDELAGMENFQSRFLKQDSLIEILKHDIADLQKLAVKELFTDGAIIKALERKLRHARGNVLTVEQEFSALKKDFSSFISDSSLWEK